MTTSIVKCSKSIKALSDPTRLAVIDMLLKEDTYVSTFIEKIKIEPTLLSHHLSILRTEGIIKSTRVGKKVLYSLIPGVKIKGKFPGLKLNSCKIIFTNESTLTDKAKASSKQSPKKSAKKISKKN